MLLRDPNEFLQTGQIQSYCNKSLSVHCQKEFIMACEKIKKNYTILKILTPHQ